MVNDLASPVDLVDFPGAPFADAVVDAAVADLRARLGWHVAPVRPETLTLDHEGGIDLVLPSRKIGTITEIRDVSGTTPAVITGYRTSAAGYLTGCQWPRGTATIEVDLTHGYATPPPDLLAAVAALCGYLKSDSRVRSVQIDDFQTSYYGTSSTGMESQVMTTYGLPRDF